MVMGTKASGNDYREHTGVVLTCVPRAGLPLGSALQGAPQGWPTQGVHFGSAPAHGLSFPMPAGAVVTNWLSCGQAVGTGVASWQVSAMMYFFPVCQIPRNTMAWQMEHPTGLLRAGGMLRESTVCAKKSSEGENYLLLKRETFAVIRRGV